MPACVNENNSEQRQNISTNELKRSFCAIRKYSAWDRISKKANAAVSKQHTASSCRGFPPLFLAFCARASFSFSASSGFCVSQVPSIQRRLRTRKEIIRERRTEGQESRQTKHPQGLPQLCCLSRPFALTNCLSLAKLKVTSSADSISSLSVFSNTNI